ncbi:hypothetical protein F5Y16DRAFT_370141 [Xylariaceae sp. FL0255]|nr:hypothetical protein F5Y16DRAFT_370141 [Xylariaceae sp. FL0255]
MKEQRSTNGSFEFLNYRTSEQTLADATIRGPSVKHNAFWSYCGPLLKQEEDIPPSMKEWSTAVLSKSILPQLMPLLAYANEVLTEHGLDHYWLTVRATKATAEFNKPRWHTDDMFFKDTARKGGDEALRKGSTVKNKNLALQTNWKLCATLLGPSTLFIPDEHQVEARKIQRAAKRDLAMEHDCTSIRCVGCASVADAVRERLAGVFESLGTRQAEKGACAVFRIGQDDGAVHSEPRMSDGDRVFVNIVPGREDELRNFLAKWGMEFPRSWWIAPGVLRQLNNSG